LQLFAQLLVNGLASGMIYVLAASGLILVLGVARIFNFAHGEFYMLGAYGVFAMSQLVGLDFTLSLVISILLVALFAAISYGATFHHIRGRLLPCAAASMGWSMLIRQNVFLIFGTKERGMPSVFEGLITVGGITLSKERLMVIPLCLLVMLGLYLFLMKTKHGKAMRAVRLDSDAASLQGIDVNIMNLLAMVIGCTLAGIAGAFMAPIFAVEPFMGHSILLMVFLVLILGGVESGLGAVMAGILLGLLLSFGYYFFGGLAEMVVFAAVGVILIFRPGGLFGHVVEV
jgi:branched-chain amino acid transport system permease protein